MREIVWIHNTFHPILENTSIAIQFKCIELKDENLAYLGYERAKNRTTLHIPEWASLGMAHECAEGENERIYSINYPS